jgi:16S rRNA (guanine1207-N2)-methyltransferase
MTPAIRPQEQLLQGVLAELPVGRALCNTAGWGQLAVALARRDAAGRVDCWLLDLYQLEQCRHAGAPLPENLRLVCTADPPPEEVDLVAWSFSRQGDGELSRELLQIGHQRLRLGGRMACAIDNPRDQWLQEQLRRLFPKVTRRPGPAGALYLATKAAPLKKPKDYAAEFSFRDGERTIHLRTRPSVFNHRALDGGARALIKVLEVAPGQRVLDLGCGSGAVALAAAVRAEGVRVHAIDSNPRAIEAVLWAGEQNGVAARLTAELDCDGRSLAKGAFDLVLANPPYYSNFRLAALFLRIAAAALAVGGRLLVVTKTTQWYVERLKGYGEWGDTQIAQRGGYSVVAARKRR